MKLQDQNQQLITHNSKLRFLTSDLKSQLSLMKRQSLGTRKKGNLKVQDPLLNHELIVKLGKKYSVMVNPWASSSIFLAWPAKDAPTSESPARFKDYDTFSAGLLKEFHEYLNNSDLCEKAAEYAPFKTSVCINTSHFHCSQVTDILLYVVHSPEQAGTYLSSTYCS